MNEPPIRKPAVPGSRNATLCGIILLLLWGAWWVASFARFEMVGADRLWFWTYDTLGLDFFHNYAGARAWVAGVNPYLNDIGDVRGRYSYPPIVLPMFAWCALFDFKVAAAIWAACVAAAIAWGAHVGQQVRRANGLPSVSLVFATALLLWSMPAAFAMERGNADALVLLAVIGAALAWGRKPSPASDAVIGACLAVAAWVKVYPLVLFAVPVVAGRWRALLLALGIFAAVGLIPYRATQDFLEASRVAQGMRTDMVGAAVDWLAGRPDREIRGRFSPVMFSSHSLTTYWPKLWLQLGIPSLSRIPGLIGAAACLFPIGAWVTYAFWRSRGRDRWVFPFMLWLTALATFWMPLSFDYNFFFLPLAMWAVWDHRDGVLANLALASAGLWWQPLRLPQPFTPELLFFVKFLSLIVAGQALVRRLARAGRGPRPVAEARTPKPATNAASPTER